MLTAAEVSAAAQQVDVTSAWGFVLCAAYGAVGSLPFVALWLVFGRRR